LIRDEFGRKARIKQALALAILLPLLGVPIVLADTGTGLEITFDRQLSGDRVGQHKAPPLSPVNMTITATVSSQVENSVLADYFPSDWTVINANGGIVSIYDENYSKIEWDVGTVSDSVSRSYVIKSPQRTLPPTKYYFHSELTYGGGSATSGDWVVIVSDPTFGYSTVGGTETGVVWYNITGSWFTCPENGTADSISVYMKAQNPGQQGPVQSALYRRSDGSFVAGTNEISMTTTLQWWTFTFSSPPSLTAGTDYWIVMWGNYANYLYCDTETDKGGSQTEDYGKYKWPSTFSPTIDDKKYSIYCTYTAAPVLAWQLIETWTGTVKINNEVVEQRTADSKTWALGGNKYKTTISPKPIHYYESGVWKDIDLNLIDVPEDHPLYAEGYRKYCEKNTFVIATKPDISSENFLYILPRLDNGDYGEYYLKVILAGMGYLDIENKYYEIFENTNSVTGAVENNEELFENVFSETNFKYTAQARMLKEQIIFKDPSVLPDPENMGFNENTTWVVWSFELDWGDLKVWNENSENADVDNVDAMGLFFGEAIDDIKYLFPTGRAWDNSDNEEHVSDVRYRLVHEGGRHFLLAGVEYSWLVSPELVYPVYIDPTTTVYPTLDGYIKYQNGAYKSVNTTGADLLVGEYKPSLWYRAFIRFDASPIPDSATIDNATFYAYYYKNDSGTTEEGVAELAQIEDIGATLDSTDWGKAVLNDYGTFVERTGSYGWYSMRVDNSITPTSDNVSYRLKDNVEDLDTTRFRWHFYSTEAVQYNPYLEVYYTEAPTEWQLVETWTGTVSAPAAWQLIGTWTSTVSALTQWNLIESWTGTVRAPAAWNLIESWIGTVRAPAAWNLIESWTGTVRAPAAWNLIESWTGTVRASAAWSLIESWTGTVRAPTAWNLIESWIGTVRAPAAWQLIESWTGVVKTVETVAAPSSSVDPISLYWQTSTPFTVTATASDGDGYVENVELWYRYSTNDLSWGPWTSFGLDNDNSDGWSWSFTAPEGDGYYEFHSIARDDDGNVEEASWAADVICGVDRAAPSAPDLVSPTSGTTTDVSAPTFDWSDVTDLSGVTYTFEIIDTLTKTGLTSSNYTLTSGEALPDGTYSWRVRAIDGAGNVGDWHETWSLTVSTYVPPPPPPPPSPPPPDTTPPPTPSLVSPADETRTEDNTSTFDWSDVTDSSGVTYTLEIIDTLTKTGLTSSNYTLTSDEALAEGTYSWRVRAVDGAGNTGNWSSTWSLTVTIPMPPGLPTSSVGLISPYWQTAVPFTVTATASDNDGYVTDVALYYRYSSDNSSWDNWTLFWVDRNEPWSWSFTALEGDGYYEFYSIAKDNENNEEPAPLRADAWSLVVRVAPIPQVTIVFIPGGGTGVADFTPYDIPLLAVTITTVENDENDVVVTVEMLGNIEVSVPPGIVYSYKRITLTNITHTNVKGLLTRFRVSRSWVVLNDIDDDTITLLRFSGNRWQELPTELVDTDANYLYLEASMEGFSLFAVTGEPKEVVVVPPPSSMPVFYALLTTFATLGGGAVAYVRWFRPITPSISLKRLKPAPMPLALAIPAGPLEPVPIVTRQTAPPLKRAALKEYLKRIAPRVKLSIPLERLDGVVRPVEPAVPLEGLTRVSMALKSRKFSKRRGSKR